MLKSTFFNIYTVHPHVLEGGQMLDLTHSILQALSKITFKNTTFFFGDAAFFHFVLPLESNLFSHYVWFF